MFIVLNLLLIFGISILVVASFKFSAIRWIVSFLFSLFINLQLGSLYIGGSLIDYKFYVHFNLRDMMAMQSLFTSQIIIFLISLVILVISIYWLSTKVIKLNLYLKKLYQYGFIIVSFIILSINGGIINNIIKIIRIVNAEDVSFKNALYNLDMETYIPSDEIIAKQGKNIIIISLESYERGYLSDEMAHITPNMRSLSKRWNYYVMKQTSGSGWTSASLYTYLTGFPSFFQGNGNLVFEKSQYSHITGISHVLNHAGYQMTFLVGNAEFAGAEDLLKAFEITNIIDQRKLKEKYETNSSWGLHDKDLFEEAKLEVLSKKKSEKPFSLFISTISTHNPDGVYDKRMEGLVGSQKSNLEFMAASVDYLIGDFVEFLEAEDMLSNTIVYIFPDHLKMGDATMFRNTGDRELFLLTNASTDNFSFGELNSIYQIDLPKIILDGAVIEHNAKFLTNYIEGDKEEYIRNNSVLIAELNSSGLVRKGFWTEELIVELDSIGDVIVRFDENIITINSDTSKTFVTSLSFSNEMMFKEIHYNSRENPSILNSNLALSLYVKDGLLFSYLHKNGRTPILKSHKERSVYTLEDVKTINMLISSKAQSLFIWENNKLIEVKSKAEQNYVQNLKNIPYNLTEAIIEIEYYTIGDAIPFLIFYGQPYSTSTLVLHDRLPNSKEKSTLRFSFNKFVQNPALVFRNWSKEGEFIITQYKILGNGYRNDLDTKSKVVHEDKYDNDRNRFIAHAGGSINGHTYTNSLEALNLSYDKGFRLFELDIIKTSDGKYVAAHDWNHWSKITGYRGALPISEKEFLKHKIYGNLTPMNMEIINSWFKKHKDAILVTDKVNTPIQFAQVFLDKNRLMMELFSLEAVKEGLNLGIRSSMPSENVVNSLGKDKFTTLKSLGVKNIAVSRRYIASNILFLERLKENNIKTYVFHVNFDEGKDENYVVNNEMEYIYGLYADNWIFK